MTLFQIWHRRFITIYDDLKSLTNHEILPQSPGLVNQLSGVTSPKDTKKLMVWHWLLHLFPDILSYPFQEENHRLFAGEFC